MILSEKSVVLVLCLCSLTVAELSEGMIMLSSYHNFGQDICRVIKSSSVKAVVGAWKKQGTQWKYQGGEEALYKSEATGITWVPIKWCRDEMTPKELQRSCGKPDSCTTKNPQPR